jgi:hypothetical protein
MRYRRSSTQREFLKIAEQEPVAYVHPASFQAGEAVCAVTLEALGRFQLRLSRFLSFDDYDRLIRAIYVAHLRQPTKPVWPGPK